MNMLSWRSRSKGLSFIPGVSIGMSLLFVIAIGLGIRFWPQTHLTPSHSNDQAGLAEASGIQAPLPALQPTMQAATSTVAPASKQTISDIAGHQLLFNNAIQSHLATVAQVRQVASIGMSVSNFYLTGGHLFISVCFAAPGTEKWHLGPATLTYANGDLSSFAGHSTLDKVASASDQVGQHCDTLEFQDLPAGADLSRLNLSVQSVFLEAGDEGHECEVASARWAKSANLKQLGITAQCTEYPGYYLFKVITKPAAMTDDEAQNILGREASGMTLGPWNFENVALTTDK
jgi:hypothetical protein